MNLHELFEKFETEFLAGHEKIKTGLTSNFSSAN